ncbi:hypothetical protein BMS3Abin02_00186 [bacterium BMS3Abin02]|nr:hypothetical protein BMS3Abin02_00186 [bacterium BMS3Abin02]
MSDHRVDDVVAALQDVLRLASGVVDPRVTDRNEHGCGLCDGELVEALAEVLLCGSFHAVGAPAEIHRVQVELENLVFRVATLQFDGDGGLSNLAGERRFVADEVLLDDLLGDRRTTALFAIPKIVDEGAADCSEVDPFVFIERRVLGGQSAVDDDLRNVLDADRLAVLAIVQLGQFLVGERVDT